MKRENRRKTKFPDPQKANECIAGVAARTAAVPEMLFDEFWREGELAMMFGASGTGKSILAVQVGEALARGRALDGFRMPRSRRHKVLYVDLDGSAKRFSSRYSVPGADGTSEARPYKFAESFYRDTPPSTGKLIEWLREMVCERGFRVVIIDSLASVRTTADGAKEPLVLMRELRRLTHETDVSVLVIADADAPPRGRFASEADLRRSRILCSAAESVFALGLHPRGTPGTRALIETRSKNAVMVWTEHNAPLAHIERRPTGMLDFAFDNRFVEGLDDETRELVSRVKVLRDAGKTYTEVAEELEISRSRVVRLFKKWRPGGEQSGVSDEQDEVLAGERAVPGSRDDEDAKGEDYDEARYLRDCGLSDPAQDDAGDPSTTADGQPAADNTRLETGNIPFGAGMGRRSVYDLPMQRDSYGDPYYVEKAIGPNNYVTLYYKVNKENILLRCERRGFGVFITRVGPAPYLPRD